MKKNQHGLSTIKKLLMTLLMAVFLFGGCTTVTTQLASPATTPMVQWSDRIQVVEDTVYINWHEVALAQYMEITRVLNYMKAMNLNKMKLILNNGGGNVAWMIGIYDQLVEAIDNGLQLNTQVYGRAASAAVPLMLLGKERVISKNSHVMLHPPSGTLSLMISQDVKDLREEWVRMYAWIVADRTKLKYKDVVPLLQGSTTLDITVYPAAKALELGFATKIN